MSPKQQQQPRPEEGTSGPLDQLIARFQIETDEKLGRLHEDTQRALSGMERRIAQLQDNWTKLEANIRELRGSVDDGLHHMRNGVAEVNIALKEAVKQAQVAASHAAVFEKLRASQPDFHKAVHELAVKVAHVQDANTHTLAQLTDIGQRLDQFEMVTADAEEVRGTLRSLDGIVKDLNTSEQKRRKGIAG